MGFYNIMLEGQQVEEYKARKAKEAEEKYKENEERVKRRLRSGIKTQGDFEDKYYNDDPDAIKDQDRFMHAKKVVQRDDNSRFNPATVYDRKFRGLDGNAWTDDRDAVNRHMRRHPDQWDGDKRVKTRSEACGIFESVEFLNERGSFKAKKEIKNSEDYARMKEIVKEYKKEKDEEKKDKLRNEGVEIIDKLITEAEDIPSDGFFEWIARFIIRQFDNGFRLFVNLVLGFTCFKCTKYMTRSDFLDQLYEIKADIQKKK